MYRLCFTWKVQRRYNARRKYRKPLSFLEFGMVHAEKGLCA